MVNTANFKVQEPFCLTQIPAEGCKDWLKNAMKFYATATLFFPPAHL